MPLRRCTRERRVSCDEYHTCMRLNDATGRCFGANECEQNTEVTGISDRCLLLLLALETSSSHNSFLPSSVEGQLGDGSDNDRHYAGFAVATPSGGIAHLAGTAVDRSCLVLLDGTARCFGNNALGRQQAKHSLSSLRIHVSSGCVVAEGAVRCSVRLASLIWLEMLALCPLSGHGFRCRTLGAAAFLRCDVGSRQA